jgi:DNA-binding PadR family transcriptional regulator
MTASKLLEMEEKLVDGKIRKYYRTTSFGSDVLLEAKKRAPSCFGN